FHPGDVISHSSHLPALECGRWNQHGKIRFSARAGESSGNVSLSSVRGFHTEQEHMLGHPPFAASQITANAERKTFLSEKHISAIAGSDGNDRVLLWKMADEATLRVEIENRMN